MFGMKSSWRTTVFGYLSAIGGAVVAGIASGIIDPSHLPAWTKSLAALLMVIGTAGLGAFARDNCVTSEQAGSAKPFDQTPKP